MFSLNAKNGPHHSDGTPSSTAPTSPSSTSSARRYLIPWTLERVTDEEYLADQALLREVCPDMADYSSDSGRELDDDVDQVSSRKYPNKRLEKSLNPSKDMRSTRPSQSTRKISRTTGHFGRKPEDGSTSAEKPSPKVHTAPSNSRTSAPPSLDVKGFVAQSTKASGLSTFPAYDERKLGRLERLKVTLGLSNVGT